jgi:hypothetical protein
MKLGLQCGRMSFVLISLHLTFVRYFLWILELICLRVGVVKIRSIAFINISTKVRLVITNLFQLHLDVSNLKIL